MLAVIATTCSPSSSNLNLNPEVSKPTIKLILSRRNIQPMAQCGALPFWGDAFTLVLSPSSSLRAFNTRHRGSPPSRTRSIS